MEPQFEELAQRIADVVDQRFAPRFNDAEKQLTSRFDDAEKRLGTAFADAEKRLSHGMKMHTEQLKDVVKLAAEGYGATLERIDRQLAELNAKVDTKFGDNDKVLQDHASRINALERTG